jgi:hypothetical protein
VPPQQPEPEKWLLTFVHCCPARLSRPVRKAHPGNALPRQSVGSDCLIPTGMNAIVHLSGACVALPTEI